MSFGCDGVAHNGYVKNAVCVDSLVFDAPARFACDVGTWSLHLGSGAAHGGAGAGLATFWRPVGIGEVGRCGSRGVVKQAGAAIYAPYVGKLVVKKQMTVKK